MPEPELNGNLDNDTANVKQDIATDGNITIITVCSCLWTWLPK